MSDFLSNFNKMNYKETKGKKQDTSKDFATENVSLTIKSEPETPINQRWNETEPDPSYHKKRKKKFLLMGITIAAVMCIVFVAYYQMTHITLPNFSGKNLAEARAWATENKIILNVKQVYNGKSEANKVISQSVKTGNKIKKGAKLTIESSLGADPEEKLILPDFMTMKKAGVEKWVKENKADNLSIIDEYSDTQEKGMPIRFELVNKEVNKENYRRKDKATMYYSKGKETVEKNISVPDFTKKMKTEVENWAKTNNINITYEETSSAEVPVDSIISQSIAKDQKIAKKDPFTVQVSLGKGYTIPDFSEYSVEEANAAVEGVTVQVKSIFTTNVPYGQLISQSMAAGTKLTIKDDLKVKVHYSAGQPYLKDLRGNTVEGDLQKYFYDEFQSKGAAIQYTIRYVDSSEPKGTVVGMSAYGLYIPLDYTVALDISLGNLAEPPIQAQKKSDKTVSEE